MQVFMQVLWRRCGKTVHNSTETGSGLMQVYGEGFDIPNGKSHNGRPGDERCTHHVGEIAEVWRRAERSFWLPDLAGRLAEGERPEKHTGCLEPSGAGRVPVVAAVPEAVAANVPPRAPFTPCRSRLEHRPGEKTFAAMRYGVGGHLEHMLHQK